jgi:RNA polymerase sigma-70 factor (ECF subfamily)
MAENGGCLDLAGSAAERDDEEVSESDGVGEPDVRELFLELRTPICRYLISLGLNRTEAEDVAQESFLRLCARDDHPENARAWMFRVAHNLAQDEHRRRKRKPSESWQDEGLERAEPEDRRPSPEESLLEREQDARLKNALARLPQEHRRCLHLRAEGLRYREIAEVLQVGTSTVAEWVQKGLNTLGKELGKENLA